MTHTVSLIAKNIKHFRDIKNFSQKEICADSGVPQGQYSRIENGKAEPSVSTLEKLDKVFGISISEFFNSTDIDTTVNLPLLEKLNHYGLEVHRFGLAD